MLILFSFPFASLYRQSKNCSLKSLAVSILFLSHIHSFLVLNNRLFVHSSMLLVSLCFFLLFSSFHRWIFRSLFLFSSYFEWISISTVFHKIILLMLLFQTNWNHENYCVWKHFRHWPIYFHCVNVNVNWFLSFHSVEL